LADVVLYPRVLDFGLDALDSECDEITVCSQQPTTYNEATLAPGSGGYCLGIDNFGVGNAFGVEADATPDGRQISSTAIVDGLISVAGSVAAWAAVDSVNSRLLATGILTDGRSVLSGQTFTLGALTVRMPAVPPVDDAEAWVAAVVANGGSVSAGRQSLVRALIAGLKTDGIFTKLDRLWLLPAENQPSALTDIVANSLATAVNSPTFTTDRGYTGEDNASPTKYISTTFNPSGGGFNYTLNLCHLSVWLTTNTTVSSGGATVGSADSGNESVLFTPFAGGTIFGRLNVTGGGGFGTDSSYNHYYTITRNTSTTVQAYRDGAAFGSPIGGTTTALVNRPMFMLAYNSGGSVAYGNSNQVAAVSMGGLLSSTDAANLYTRLRTYMTAVGVP
jgi:hypothetical protein